MAKKGETRLQRAIQRRLKKKFNVWLVKIHGGPFQSAGIPDLLGCCASIFFGFEVKKPKGRVSVIQKETMRDITKKGGGYCAIVTTPDEAEDALRRILRKEGRMLEGIKAVAKARGRLRRRAIG